MEPAVVEPAEVPGYLIEICTRACEGTNGTVTSIRGHWIHPRRLRYLKHAWGKFHQLFVGASQAVRTRAPCVKVHHAYQERHRRAHHEIQKQGEGSGSKLGVYFVF